MIDKVSLRQKFEKDKHRSFEFLKLSIRFILNLFSKRLYTT